MMIMMCDIMIMSFWCIGVNDFLSIVVLFMVDLDVGVLFICGEDSRFKGMFIDCDIVVNVIV